MAVKSSGSVLASVAKHEQELLAKIESSKEEAKSIVDQARADARKLLQSEEGSLTEEVARIRAEAETVRLAAFEKSLQEVEARLAGVRDKAAQRIPKVAESVLNLFMPSGSKGK